MRALPMLRIVLLACVVALAPAVASGKQRPPAPPPAPLPLAPLTPPPPAPDAARVLTATAAEAEPRDPGPAAATTATEAPRPPEARQPFSVAPRAGLFVPRGGLGLGPLAGLELGVLLPIRELHPWVDQRLSIVAAAGWVETGLATPAIVPGRGYDAGFSQRSAIVPGELVLRWRVPLPDDAPVELGAEAGFGLLGTWTTFRSFSAEQEQSDLAPAFVGALQLELPLGPGRALLRIADFEATAELGPLGPAAGSVGEGNLSGIAIAAGYAISFGN